MARIIEERCGNIMPAVRSATTSVMLPSAVANLTAARIMFSNNAVSMRAFYRLVRRALDKKMHGTFRLNKYIQTIRGRAASLPLRPPPSFHHKASIQCIFMRLTQAHANTNKSMLQIDKKLQWTHKIPLGFIEGKP